jgi:hypothetical protein
MPDRLHLCMLVSAGVWRGGFHLLSAVRGYAHRVNLPSVLVFVRHMGILKGLCHLSGDYHTSTGGLASRARRCKRAGAQPGLKASLAGRYSRNTSSGSDRLRLGETPAGGSGVWGTVLPCPERRPSVSSWAGLWTAIGRGVRAGQAGRELERDWGAFSSADSSSRATVATIAVRRAAGRV